MSDIAESIVLLCLGIFLGVGIGFEYGNRGQDECEKSLPRTQKCVKVWTPEVKP